MFELNTMILATASSTTGKIADVVTSGMMQGVLDEVIALLPVCIPVMISFIGLRKGISFIQSVLHAAQAAAKGTASAVSFFSNEMR